MSQNELLDCILTRLDDLEASQTQTTLRVRVLLQKLMQQKMKALAGKSLSALDTMPFPITATLKEESANNFDTDIREGEGDNDAAVLASMWRPATVNW